MILLFPGNFNLAQNIFSSVIHASMIFFALGIIVAYFAGQILTSLFCLSGFAFFAIFRSDWSLLLYVNQISILFSSAILLFSFNMITDPVTAPKTIPGKFYYGISLAIIDAIFRSLYIPYGNFYALFIVTALIPVIKSYGISHSVIISRIANINKIAK